MDLKADPIAFLRFSGVRPFTYCQEISSFFRRFSNAANWLTHTPLHMLTLNLDVDLLAVLGVDVDWLVESKRGVFNDLAKLVVERLDRGVLALNHQSLL